MTLQERLAQRISQSGPMPISDFMDACLHDPEYGYYAVHPAISGDGDFITAPAISQMFGELLGAWTLEIWRQLGRPNPFHLIEMGPGDGTLLGDVVRTARLDPDFLAAAEIWLVESSQPLRQRQGQRLLGLRRPPQWVERIEQAPPGAPFILLANELLDCLPVRQFIKDGLGWAERVIGLEGDELAFGLTRASVALVPEALRDSPVGSLVEVSLQQQRLGAEVGERLRTDPGAALFIDYGRSQPGFGDTLQALLRHQKVDPLKTAGAADLTVHADFPAFVHAAVRAGAEATAIIPQGRFLMSLGLGHRAEALARSNPGRQDRLIREVERLCDPDEMGDLFKAVTLHSKGLRPPGF